MFKYVDRYTSGCHLDECDPLCVGCLHVEVVRVGMQEMLCYRLVDVLSLTLLAGASALFGSMPYSS